MLATPVLVTRPEREARPWVEALRRKGLAAHSLPLIAIAPPPETHGLSAFRTGLNAYRAVMFVSANAVHGLLANAQQVWPEGTQAWATGPGTRQALRDVGVPDARIDSPCAKAPQFDSEALWAQVGAAVVPGDRVLIVRGGDAAGQPAGREWLATQLEAAGARVDIVVAYVRHLPHWDADQRALARQGASGRAWWIFSSSEGVDNLLRLMPDQDWSAARAVCTHLRIGQAARSAGFGVVAQSRPALNDVVAFLQSQP